MDALTSGTLVSNGRCFYVTSGLSERVIIWPYGYYAEANPLRVVDDHGHVFAKVGQKVSLGGGYVPLTHQILATIPAALRRCFPPLPRPNQIPAQGPQLTLWVM
jgi:hypothetical protein